jgi:1,2-phenylacetyl-CoA epoxidase catalytic subunit
MPASITVSSHPSVQYLLRIGDTCLIHAQRLGEWSGHAPIVEEDIALTNMALDLIGQARALLTRAGSLEAELGGVRTTRTSSRSCATSATFATARSSSCRAATSR